MAGAMCTLSVTPRLLRLSYYCRLKAQRGTPSPYVRQPWTWHQGCLASRALARGWPLRKSKGLQRRLLKIDGPKPYAGFLTTCASATREGGNEEVAATNVEELQKHLPKRLWTLPTTLTLLRLAAIPALFATSYMPTQWSALSCTAIFVLASITDWLDGYLARKMNLTSAFGAFLDPVVDKLMVAAALVLLCSRLPASGPAADLPWLIPLPAVLIIGREVTMSALREWAASQGGAVHKAVAVNSLGKWKTASQMVSLTLLFLTQDGSFGGGSDIVGKLGVVLLYISATLALLSLMVYMRAVWRYMRAQ